MFTVLLILTILIVAVGGAAVAPRLFHLTKNDKDQ
jgi:hypothetical protein